MIRYLLRSVFRIRNQIRIHLDAWIRIHIRNADPDMDPGGIKRAKMKGKNVDKRQTMSFES
jgi:hypothetical protein